MSRRTAALPLDQRLRLDAALEEAFAPLRASDASVSPARVRAAVRWAPTESPRLQGAALLGRAGELATAVAAAAFVFAASLAVPGETGAAIAPVRASADEVRTAPGLSLDRPEIFARWLRVGRTVTVNDLLDPLSGVSGVRGGESATDTLYRTRQGLAR